MWPASQRPRCLAKDRTLGYPVWRATQPEHALAEVAARWQASAIVVQTGTSLLPMVVRSLATGLPTAVYLHNVETHQLAGTLTPDPSLRYFANSDFHRRALARVVRHRLLRDSADYRRRALPGGTDGRAGVICQSHRSRAWKSLFALAAACPELPFWCTKAGTSPQPGAEHCQQRARALGNVRWQAPTLDMRQAYAQARVLLMPSIWEESFGRTVIEAQLNGLPVLASHRGALPALVGQGGLTLEAHAPIADWAQALRHLYAQPEAAGAAGREQAMRHVAATR